MPTPAAAVIALIVCVLAPAVLVGLQIHANPKFSPVDEAAHYDYVNRIAPGEMPRQGQHLMKSTLREIACKGNQFPVTPLPPCSTPVLRYEQFGGAYQYEALHPPTYHAITVPLRWVVQHILRVHDRLDATRVVGIAWLVVGMVLLWAAGRIMGIAPLNLGVVLLLLASAPTVVFFYATVSTDVTAVTASGVVALAAAISYRRARGAPWLLLAAGAFAAACKVTNMFAVVTISAAFLVAAIVARAGGEAWTTTARRWMRDGGPLLVGGVVTAVVWVLVHDALALISLTDEPTLAGLRGGDQSLGGVLVVGTNFFQPLTDLIFSAQTLGQPVQKALRAALAFLLVGAGFAGLFVAPRGWQHVVGLISVPALYVGGVVIGLGFMVGFGTDAGAGSRAGTRCRSRRCCCWPSRRRCAARGPSAPSARSPRRSSSPRSRSW